MDLDSSVGTGERRAARVANSSKRIVSLSSPHYRATPQQVTHVPDDECVENQRAQLERRKTAAQLVDFDRDIDPAAQRRDPLAPGAGEPQTVRLGEPERRLRQRERSERPELAIGEIGGKVEKDAWKLLRRVEVQALHEVFRRLLNIAVDEPGKPESGNEDDDALERLERRYCTQPEYGPPVRSRFYAAVPRRASAKAQTQSAPATTTPIHESSSGTVQPPICAGQAYASRRICNKVTAPNTSPDISK
jgi:hypothetical protein